MSGTQTLGFDVVYEISLRRFLRVLELLFIEDLPLRLGGVDFSFIVPGMIPRITQTGTISLPERPGATIARSTTNPNRFTLTLLFPRSSITLQAVPGGGLLPAGLPGLPVTGMGTTTLTLPLNIDTATAGGESPVTISVPGTPAPSMSRLSDLSMRDLPLLPGGTQDAMRDAVQEAASNAVVDAVRTLFPLTRGVTLPTTGPCNLFVRNMRTKLLAGDATHAESLSFMLNLQSSSTGNFTGTTVSRLPTGSEGVLLISNSLLLELICCLLPRSTSLSGLASVAPSRTPATCCRWSNISNFRLGTETVELQRFDVCIATNNIAVSGAVRKTGTGWWATASFNITVGLRNNGGVLEPVVSAPDLDTDYGVEWWVWLVAALVVIVAAVIGFFIGGPLGSAVGGAIVGGLIGALLSGIVIGVLHAIAGATDAAVRAALGTLAGTLEALQLLPADLTDTFGVLTLIGDPVIDDLTLRGQVVLPDSTPTRAQSANQIIQVGEMFNLDSGALEPRYAGTGLADLDADLSWEVESGGRFGAYVDHLELAGGGVASAGERRIGGSIGSFLFRGPSIHARGSARLVALPGRSFWGLTESDLKELPYPDTATSIGNFFVPRSDSALPAQTMVFGVRTTEGRYAKCAAWKDSAGRLHLRYRTYATRLPLELVARWTTRRGAEVGSGVERGVGMYVEYEVSRRGVFRAEPRTLQGRSTYRWLWNGREITGSGTLPDGTTTYDIVGNSCTLETQMATALAGELCVTATDATGFRVTACRALDLAGTERVRVGFGGHQFELPEWPVHLPVPPRDTFPPVGPFPGPEPEIGIAPMLELQLTRALAAGMKMKEAEIQLR